MCASVGGGGDVKAGRGGGYNVRNRVKEVDTCRWQ